MKILIMNGPNLNLLGEREPNVYGSETLDSINAELSEKAGRMGFELSFFQSNSEGELIDALHSSPTTRALSSTEYTLPVSINAVSSLTQVHTLITAMR